MLAVHALPKYQQSCRKSREGERQIDDYITCEMIRDTAYDFGYGLPQIAPHDCPSLPPQTRVA